jgi:XTP/dITP diphosphohydrolase
MKKLLFATNNEHKLREVREILGRHFEVIGLKEAGIIEEIPETSDTLQGNASQKAWYIFNKTGLDCFADDTGLEISALDGRPGVYSARYAGEGCTFDDNCRKVLEEMTGKTDRTAVFRCVICLITGGEEFFFDGMVPGRITPGKTGTAGFGYDPIFQPDGFRQTFAEMPPYLKNGISHRGRAVEKLANWLSLQS